MENVRAFFGSVALTDSAIRSKEKAREADIKRRDWLVEQLKEQPDPNEWVDVRRFEGGNDMVPTATAMAHKRYFEHINIGRAFCIRLHADLRKWM